MEEGEYLEERLLQQNKTDRNTLPCGEGLVHDVPILPERAFRNAIGQDEQIKVTVQDVSIAHLNITVRHRQHLQRQHPSLELHS